MYFKIYLKVKNLLFFIYTHVKVRLCYTMCPKVYLITNFFHSQIEFFTIEKTNNQ